MFDQIRDPATFHGQMLDARVDAMRLGADGAQGRLPMRGRHGRELSRLDIRHGFHGERIRLPSPVRLDGSSPAPPHDEEGLSE